MDESAKRRLDVWRRAEMEKAQRLTTNTQEHATCMNAGGRNLRGIRESEIEKIYKERLKQLEGKP
jgi:hypothetical protein